MDSSNHAVSPPPSGPSSASTSSSYLTARASTAESVPIRDQLQAQLETIARRPHLRALQGVSNDSISTPNSGQSSVSSVLTSGSEGGDHLIEMRDRLLSSDTPSVDNSSGDGSSPGGDDGAFELNVISATPPILPHGLRDDVLAAAGPSGRRRSSLIPLSLEEGNNLPAEYAWDSVVGRRSFTSVMFADTE